MNKHHITRAVAAATVTLLLATPLAVSAQTTDSTAPTQDQMNSVRSLTDQFFDDVHYTKTNEFDALTAPNFQVTYPNGVTIGSGDLIGRAATRNLEESGYQHQTRFGPMTTDGSTITEQVSTRDIADLMGGDTSLPTQTESAKRTLTWVQGADGNWVVASEHIDSIVQSPYGSPAGD
jgi:hypothetical protein